MTPTDGGPLRLLARALVIVAAVMALLTAGVVALSPPAKAAGAPFPVSQTIRWEGGPAKIGSGWYAGMAYTHAYDADRNGYHDIYRVAPDGRLLFYPATGTTTWGATRQVGVGFWDVKELLGGVDWNTDGIADLLTVFNDGRVVYFQGDGTGGFNYQSQIGVGFQFFSKVSVVQSALNYKPALMGVYPGGDLWMYPTDGWGNFRSPVKVGYGWGGMKQMVGAGDWNRDGLSDLLGVNPDGYLILYTTNSSGLGYTATTIGDGWGAFSKIASGSTAGTGSMVWGFYPGGDLWLYNARYYAPAPPAPVAPPENTAVFVYGTLLSGQPNNGRLAGRYSSVQRTSISNLALYRMSGYNWPWAVQRSGYTTYGEVYWIPGWSVNGTITTLDRLEQYNPNLPATNQSYVRTTMKMDNGWYAWVYVAGPRTATWMMNSGAVIPSGDWLRR